MMQKDLENVTCKEVADFNPGPRLVVVFVVWNVPACFSVMRRSEPSWK